MRDVRAQRQGLSRRFVFLASAAGAFALAFAGSGIAQVAGGGGSAVGTGTYLDGRATLTLAVSGTPEAASGAVAFAMVDGAFFTGVARCIAVEETPTGLRASIAGEVFAGSPFGPPNERGFELTVYDNTPSGQTDQISSISLLPDVATSCDFVYGRGFTLTAGDFTVLASEDEAAAVTLAPAADANPVSTTHTVTATATTQSGAAVPDTTILFTVTGAADAEGSCTTGADGRCSFTYTGPDFPGADVITACADNNENGSVDADEPCGEATKSWVLPATTRGHVTGGGRLILPEGSRVSFGFNANSDGDAVKGNCNVIDHATKTHIKCLTVDTLVVTGTRATFFGQARVDGVITNYRIDVDDLGEPGTRDTFKFQTDTGYTAAGVLDGGNVQIHR